ncbi:MAG TPA: dihydrofolate reductase [Candidatus Saccharimonadales bacterium]|nr:dihydrofolate reductase [Candidatus Saccharimonadales bacterium]
MVLSAIVAATENNVIGKDGQMPWRLPAESAYFRQTTMGHPVITGRKNYEAMGRPLPGRLNVVITRQADYKVPEGVAVAHSLAAALNLEAVKSAGEVFIIGGQQIYDEAMPTIDRLYLTIVHTKIDGGTAFFNYDPADWVEVRSDYHPADTDNNLAFTIKLFERKR